MPQGTVNSSLLNTHRNLVSADIVSVGVVLISSFGIAAGNSTRPNGGADYGPDTPGAKDYGIGEACASVANGGEVEILGGAYTWGGTASYGSNFVLFQNLTNVHVVAHRDAIFTAPLNPALYWSVNVSTNLRPALFIVSSCTAFEWEGGQFTQATGTPVQRDPVFLFGDNNSYCKIHDIYASGTNYFPIFVSGTWTNNTTGVVSSGPYFYFEEYNNTLVNNGYIGFPDGGGVRLQNLSGSTCQFVSLGLNDTILMTTSNSGLFGYDLMNPNAAVSPVWDITIHNPSINMGLNTGANPQRIGINLEVNSSSPYAGRLTVIDPHTYGGFVGMQIDGGWQGITVLGGTYEFAWTQGIYCITSHNAAFGILQDVTFVAPKCLNNNQAGGTSLRAAGLEIGFDTLGNVSPLTSNAAGVMMNISVLGGTYSDTQATPTQQYGISLLNQNNSMSPALAGTLIGVYITGGNFYGNVQAPIGTDLTGGFGSSGIGGVGAQGCVAYDIVIDLPNAMGQGIPGPLATPFIAQGNPLLSSNGNSNVPKASVNYVVAVEGALLTYVAGGATGAAIFLTGPDGTQYLTGGSVMSNQTAPAGSILNLGPIVGGSPTLTMTVNGTAVTNMFTLISGSNSTRNAGWVGNQGGGSATVPATGVVNRVIGTPIRLSAVWGSGTITAVNLYDGNGNLVKALGTAAAGERIAPGEMFAISFVGTIAPTVTISTTR
jgi:hypothetical protein